VVLLFLLVVTAFVAIGLQSASVHPVLPKAPVKALRRFLLAAGLLARGAACPEVRASCPQPYRGSRKGREAAATRSSGFAGCRGNREAELAA
jgi:hypothetical protein